MQIDRLYLRPAVVEDAKTVAEFKSDPLVRRMALGRGHETTEADERKDIERAADDEDQIYLVVVLEEGDRPIGYVRINWMEKPRFAWLRFALGAERGQGHMRAALIALLTHLFDEGLHRVDAEAYAFNERSIRLMEGLGFRREGLKREALYDGESYSDIVAFGLLRRDYEAASR
jgi:RimJ/RimL family protein N-acetyltransferase